MKPPSKHPSKGFSTSLGQMNFARQGVGFLLVGTILSPGLDHLRQSVQRPSAHRPWGGCVLRDPLVAVLHAVHGRNFLPIVVFAGQPKQRHHRHPPLTLQCPCSANGRQYFVVQEARTSGNDQLMANGHHTRLRLRQRGETGRSVEASRFVLLGNHLLNQGTLVRVPLRLGTGQTRPTPPIFSCGA